MFTYDHNEYFKLSVLLFREYANTVSLFFLQLLLLLLLGAKINKNNSLWNILSAFPILLRVLLLLLLCGFEIMYLLRFRHLIVILRVSYLVIVSAIITTATAAVLEYD